ncbi:hypothetical protein POV27_01140 [Aureisphaera galaxeae]|uniref:hypothetical protein n=1 Tax=Aureisphaera galaxeae TaxID=1538023 RepID=UPI0023509916|nr:hypothetical protein [Aureisphaera galaxeae]MDC8002642.1 hypothetical protein [Aureisphaera galaxeae]
MNFMKTLILLSCIAIASCNSTKKTVTEATDATEEVTDTQDMQTTDKSAATMESEGYLKGVIVAGKGEGSCEYVIDVKGGFAEQKVDPTNLTDAFKSDTQKVWIKFRGLRMQNRCPEARPVEITEIFARAE